MIKGIAHAAFSVADMDESLKFYCGALGLRRAFDIKDDCGNPWIVYIQAARGQFIELFHNGVKSEAESDGRLAGYKHLCLEVDDIFAIASQIKESGYPLLHEPNRGKDLNYQCWAADPDGNRIEFMQMDPGSPQMKAF